MNLYEIGSEYAKLYEMADNGDIDEQTFADTMESIEGELEDKADGYARISAQIKADISSIDKEIERLQGKKKTLENKNTWLLNNLEKVMRATGKLKFKTTLFSFSIQKNGGKEPLIINDGITANDVPPEFLRWKEPEIDKAMVREALAGGRELDWAHFGERGESLRIR